MTNNIFTLVLTRWGAGCGGLETWYAEELGCSRNGVRVFVTIQGQAVDVHTSRTCLCITLEGKGQETNGTP